MTSFLAVTIIERSTSRFVRLLFPPSSIIIIIIICCRISFDSNDGVEDANGCEDLYTTRWRARANMSCFQHVAGLDWTCCVQIANKLILGVGECCFWNRCSSLPICWLDMSCPMVHVAEISVLQTQSDTYLIMSIWSIVLIFSWLSLPIVSSHKSFCYLFTQAWVAINSARKQSWRFYEICNHHSCSTVVQ